MSFGKRTGSPSVSTGPVAKTAHARRGGYFFGIATVGVMAYVMLIVMTLIPYFNPTGRGVVEVAAMAWVAVLNVAGVAAVVFLPVDLAFRALKISAVWAYGVTGGLLVFGVCFGLSMMLGGSTPAFLGMAVLVPATVGGAVLGWFRR